MSKYSKLVTLYENLMIKHMALLERCANLGVVWVIDYKIGEPAGVRCKCCPVPIKDETIWETMYGSGMAAERIAHWNTSNWECIMNSIANIHCCCMRCEKEQDDD